MGTAKATTLNSSAVRNLLTRNFIFLCIANLLSGIAYSIVLPQFTSVMISVGFPKDKVALLNTIANFVTLFFIPIGSKLLDTYNRKYVGTVSFLVMAGGFFVSAVSQNMLIVASGKVIMNVGFQIALVSRMAMVSQVVETKYRGAGLSIWAMTTALGQVIGSAIGSPIKETLGTTEMFYAAAIACAVSALFIFGMGISAPAASEKRRTNDHKGSFFSRYEVAAIPSGVINILFSLPYTAITTYIVMFSSEEMNIANGAIYLSVYNFVNFIFRGVSARMLTKGGIRPTVTLGGAACILSMLCLTFVPGGVGFYGSAILWGMGFSLNQSSLTTYAVLGVDKSRLGAANSTYQTAGQLNGLVAGVFITALFGLVGLQYIYLTMVIPMGIGFIFLVAWCYKDIAAKEARQGATETEQK